MAKQDKRKIIDISKIGHTMSIMEFIIFGSIAIYIVVIVLTYFNTEPIHGYEIQMGSLSISKTYTGIALRQEEIITSSYTGFVNYYVREGERVSTRDVVYSIDESGRLATMLNSDELGENSYSDDELKEFRSEIIQYDRVFDAVNYSTIYDFKYDLEGSVMKLVNLDMYENMETLNQSNLGNMVNLCTTGKTGYVVYYIDGYEELTTDTLTKEHFNQTNYEKTRISNNDLISETTAPVCKMITEEQWSVVIPIDEERAVELEAEEYIKIKFIKTQETAWAEVDILRKTDGTYAVLSFQHSCSTFCSDRFVELELILNDQEGLKIPNSAIVEKEFFVIPADYMSKGGSNGNYGVLKETFDEKGNPVYEFIETNVYSKTDDEFYVDNIDLQIGDYICKPDSTAKMAVSKSDTLIGVYNMNKGYADFKQITILCQNDEYSIVSSNTQYGLTVYDRIVLDATSVNSDDFIYH